MRSRRRARRSQHSTCRRTRTEAWCRSTAAWSSACMPKWRAGRLRSRRRLRGGVSSHPRPCGGHLLLVARDLVLLDHGQADVVEAVEQAMLAERIDLELHLA